MDITDTIERKVGALHHHESQFKGLDELTRLVRALAGAAGQGHQLPLAEAFKHVRMAF